MYSGPQAEATAPRIPLASVLLSAAAAVVPPAAAAALEFDRRAVAGGEAWRLLTCHAVHYSLSHLLWSFIPFVLLAVLCERDGRARFLACLFAAAVAVPLAVTVFAPAVETYRGLSGVDSALFFLLATNVLREKLGKREWSWVAASAAVMALFVGKLLFEATTAHGVFVDTAASGMTPVPAAHLAGAAVGLLAGLWPAGGRFAKRFRPGLRPTM